MKTTRMILVSGVIGLLASIARAADVAGRWRAEFESPRGVQKYVFTFQTDGEKLTGKAVSEMGERKREAELLEAKLAVDTKDQKCPVLYLLHGIGGDETEWQRLFK